MSDSTKARPGKRRLTTGQRIRRTLLTIFLLIVLMGVGAVTFVLWGVYNVSALQQHTEPVYLMLDAALERSIKMRASSIEAPPLTDPAMIEQGLYHYRQKCVQCHGAPGVGRDDVGKGLTPVPANLVQTARTWTPAEIFWTIKHGIKMSGMPAWRFEFSDDEIWSIVAFVMQLRTLEPVEYKQMEARLAAAPERQQAAPAEQALALENRDPERGRLALQSYGCTACHSVPGVVAAPADVGPPLYGMADRRYIAGVLPNTFENMVRWIEDPVAVDPLTAMPDLDVRTQDAVDIAAYLYSLQSARGP
jgi:mono/diheme cytochrome c family protein